MFFSEFLSNACGSFSNNTKLSCESIGENIVILERYKTRIVKIAFNALNGLQDMLEIQFIFLHIFFRLFVKPRLL